MQQAEAKKATGGLFARFRRNASAKGAPQPQAQGGVQAAFSMPVPRDSAAPMQLG